MFDSSELCKVKSDGANRKPVGSAHKCFRGSNLASVAVSQIFRVKILTLTIDPSGSSKVKYDGAKLGAGLQQTPVCHPAKFHPDRANDLRNVRYQSFFSF